MSFGRKFLIRVSAPVTVAVGVSLGNDVFAILKIKSVDQINIGINGMPCSIKNTASLSLEAMEGLNLTTRQEAIGEIKSPNKVIVERQKMVDNGLDKDPENFVNVIGSRKMEEWKCSIDPVFHVAMVCQMGNMAFCGGNIPGGDKSMNKFSDKPKVFSGSLSYLLTKMYIAVN